MSAEDLGELSAFFFGFSVDSVEIYFVDMF